MIKYILTLFLTLTSFEIFAAASLPNCSNSDLSMNGANEDSCISTCSAIADYSSAQLSSNNNGFCIGNATESKFNIYKVQLGTSTSAEPTCTIWNGDFEVDKSSYAPGNSISIPGVYQNCSNGTYDTVFLTISRNETFAADTVFPDGSGKIVRTTSTFDSDDIDDNTTPSDYVESSQSHSDDDLPYVRPSTGWSNIYKKLSSTPSSTDLASSSNAAMIYDWAKLHPITTSGGSNYYTNVFSGWYCEDSNGNLCEKLDGDNRLLIRLTSSVDGVSFPTSSGIEVTDTNQPGWDIGYFGLNTSTERGAIFLWRNDSGTLKYLGVKPGDAGLQVTISNSNVE